MKLNFIEELCTECHACELKCSMEKYNVYNVEKGALRIKSKFPDSPDLVYCRQCNDAPCIDACPTNALIEVDGIVKLSNEECVNCGECVEACPFESIFHTEKIGYFKCDTCEGEYKCVKACATEALHLTKEG